MAGYSDFIRFDWDVLPDKVMQNLMDQYNKSIQSSIYQVIKAWAPLVEAWMKENAPWQDITGDARAGLIAKAHLVFNEYAILRISHSVPYGTYLEGWNPETNSPMTNAGTWSIVEPALDYFGPKIWADIKSRIER